VAPDDLDARMRQAMFAHLDRLRAKHPDGIASQEINSFVFDGQPVRLIVQPGIRKPAILTAALTIRTAFTPDGGVAPYADDIGSDGNLHYKWRGTDENHPDNRALREAMLRNAPLAYFLPVSRGVYEAIYPVFLVEEHVSRHEFSVDVVDGPRTIGVDVSIDRRYAHRLTLQRLHQALFRPKVLRAYESRCAVCRLAHVSLLDAAHILPDRHARGDAVVPNGLAMCKIHHAAYDANIIGVRPDRIVEVRNDVLTEIDGPMLRHGLQEMHGTRLFVPPSRRDRPDPSRLEERYEEFRAAA
jgi:putative restriction endonuclease